MTLHPILLPDKIAGMDTRELMELQLTLKNPGPAVPRVEVTAFRAAVSGEVRRRVPEDMRIPSLPDAGGS